SGERSDAPSRGTHDHELVDVSIVCHGAPPSGSTPYTGAHGTPPQSHCTPLRGRPTTRCATQPCATVCDVYADDRAGTPLVATANHGQTRRQPRSGRRGL